MIRYQEYEKLKEAKEVGYEWVARDKSGWVCAYKEKPVIVENIWHSDKRLTALYLTECDSEFGFLSREDAEPYNIDELIEEYEDSKEYTDTLLIKYLIDKAKESE